MSQSDYPWLERATALVLLLVVLALGWMAVAAGRPEWATIVDLNLQVVAVCALLAAALVLVSVVALLHTKAIRR